MTPLVRTLAVAGASLLSLAIGDVAFGQAAQAPAADDAASTEIVVSARRREESAQDVPLVVNAVSAERLDKLNIRDFTEVQNVVPGLQLQPSANGVQPTITIRGINNDVTAAGNNGTVQFYLNDAPISPTFLLTSMYDVGQIEVLRGPQGTLRGRAAPSGALTVTTRRPDLREVGGYVNMTGAEDGAINVNAAVGVPIIKDVLAVRVAALYTEDDASRIHVQNGTRPFSDTHSERVSVRFDPVDNLSFNASYTNLLRHVDAYTQVESANIANPTAAASPTLVTADQRLSLMPAPSTLREHFQTYNWQGDWRFAGQRLVYVGSFTKEDFLSGGPTDTGNAFLGFPAAARLSGQTTITKQTEESHELRLQSDERVAGMFDYVVGGMIFHTKPDVELALPTPLFQGIGRNPQTFTPTAQNFLLTNYTQVLRNSDAIERSLYADLTAHLGDRTELSGGARYISYHTQDSTVLPTLGVTIPQSDKEHHWIYSGSLKHRFSAELMAYASVGSSWRPGSTTNTIIDTNRNPSPVEAQFQRNQPSETSTSYEIGFKSNLFDRKVMLNVSAFHQDFKNYIISFPTVYIAYTDPATGAQSAKSVGLSGGVPAKVDGIEAEIGYRPVKNWSLDASVAYAKSRIKNGLVPCNLFTGTPTYSGIIAASGGETIGTCRVNYSASRTAPFSAVVQSEYTAPLSNQVDGFIRGLVNFQGKNHGDPSNPFDDVSPYALVNLYTGIRSPDGAWEVSLFAKNLFDVQKVTTRGADPISVGYQQLTCGGQGFCGGRNSTAGGNIFTSYRLVTTNPPREVGLNVRYAFGAR